MQLSIRLQAVAAMAADAERLADIGTDHGYVPIFLAQQGKLAHAVAMDVNDGPLRRAKEHIRLYQMEEIIETRRSDGARGLKPGEADTVVIAGMGGALTIRILQEGEGNLAPVRALVLQPQSEIEQVRRFLHAHGLAIVQEDMVKEEGKYYPMMKAVRAAQEPWEDVEYRYGKLLIRAGNPCLAEYLKKEERTIRTILDGLADRSGEHIRARRESLQRDLRLAREAERRMAL